MPAHARFNHESSDFLAYLNLWRYVREQRAELGSSQFRKRLKSEHLHYLRVREWQDLAGQLRSAGQAGGRHLQRRRTPSRSPSTRRCSAACSPTSG